MTKIIVDSTCDLPDELLAKYDIITVPMQILLDGKAYLDKLNIQPSDVYDAMRGGIVPKTAQVDLNYLEHAFEDCCKKGLDFIYLSFSSALSCTHQSATIVLADMQEKYPDIHMAAVDSKGGSLATGLIAHQAAKLIEKGYDFDSVVSSVDDMISHVEHILTIMDLKWLVKGGRIDPIKAAIGSLLNVKPIIDVKNGYMDIIKKVRGSNNAIMSLIEIMADRIREFPEQLIGIAHTGNREAAESLKSKIATRLGATNFIISEIGSVLGAHIGIGALGVFFFNKKPALYIP